MFLGCMECLLILSRAWIIIPGLFVMVSLNLLWPRAWRIGQPPNMRCAKRHGSAARSVLSTSASHTYES